MDVATFAGTAVLPQGHAHRRDASLAFHPAGTASLPNSRPYSPALQTDPLPYAETFTSARVTPAPSAANSRSSSPVLTSALSFTSRRYPPSPTPSAGPFLRPKDPPRIPHFARRVSLTLQDYAHAASRPSTYVHFVRSLHPSLLALFFVSVSATLSNKALLRGFFHGLTYSLTSWQMICATGGTVLAQRIGAYRPQRVPVKHNRELQVIAFVFSCEILCSNLALRLVPVPFHVSLRAASPILTLVLSVAFFHVQATLRASSALLAVLLGVAFTSHNEAYLSLGSLLLIASALLLTAKSLLLTYYLQSRLSLHPLDILARMSPLSALHCLVFALANGEPRRLWRFVQGREFTGAHVAEVALNGVLSFSAVALGLVAEKKTRAPAMAITTHAAQATTIVSSVLLFGLRLSPLNFLGVALTLGGGVLYALWDARDREDEGYPPQGGGGAEEGLPTRAPVEKPD
ncbi:hypothetical protein JCM10450v2_004610 [Rhodotorula kratochvilovae]